MKLRTNDLSWREIDGEMVLLDLRTSKYLTSNRVGTTLLRMLIEGRSVAGLAEALVAEFGIPRSTALTDTQLFLDDLDDRGLLEPVD